MSGQGCLKMEVWRNCRGCNSPFLAMNSSHRYCSEECRRHAESERRRGKPRPAKEDITSPFRGTAVDRMRLGLGLRPIQRGKIRCLKCEKKFYSPDILHCRLCPNCKG